MGWAEALGGSAGWCSGGWLGWLSWGRRGWLCANRFQAINDNFELIGGRTCHRGGAGKAIKGEVNLVLDFDACEW